LGADKGQFSWQESGFFWSLIMCIKRFLGCGLGAIFMEHFQNFLESQKVYPTVCAKWGSGGNGPAIVFVVVFLFVWVLLLFPLESPNP
jgi:hypothetical protein